MVGAEREASAPAVVAGVVALASPEMATRHRTFSFASHDIGGIVVEMANFASGADGRRWLNIVPDVDENEIHTGSGMWQIFSSRGPVVPQLTWFPAHEHRGRPQAAQVGLAHASGKGAIDRLQDANITVPRGWVVMQDHQKRGVIFTLDEPAALEPIVTFGMAALRQLSPFGFEDAFLATFSQQ